MIKRFYIYVLFIFLGFSCSSNQDGIVVIDIGNSELLETERTSNIYPSCYLNIHIVDSIFTLIDLCNNNFLYSYNLDYDSLFANGIVGRGPQDFTIPLFAQYDKAPIAISDLNSLVMRYYDKYTPSLESKGTVKLGPDYFGARDIIIDKDKVFGKHTSLGNGIIFIDDINSENEISDNRKWIPFPSFIKLTKLEESMKQRLSDNFFSVNKQTGVLVSGLSYFNSLMFFDENQKLIRNYSFSPSYANEEVEKIDVETQNISMESPIYINGLYSTEQYIYLLRYGKSVEQWVNGLHEGEDTSTLIIFDWGGNFIKSYRLDAKLQFIGVTKDNKRLIGGKILKDETVSIIEYKIPSI